MKFGIDPIHFDFIKKTLIHPVHQHGGKVWVFGSRARNNFHPYSDLDLLIESSQPLPKGFLENAKEALEESSLPFKVDIVLLENLAASYQKNILKERIEIF